MSKVVVNLRLDKSLVERIDAAAGPRQRTRWMVRAFEESLMLERLGSGDVGPAAAPGGAAEELRETYAAELAAGRPKSVRSQVPRKPEPYVDPRPVPSVDPRRSQFVRAASLVTPEIKSEWEEIMASRQARLNKHRDGAA